MPKLGASRFLEYFESIGESVGSTSEGDVVCLSAREALVFSAQAGAHYIFSNDKTFSPKDLLKFFNRVSSFQPIWGVCDGPDIVNSPRIWAQEHPSLSSGQKYVLPVELNDEQEMATTISRIRKNPRLADNTLIFRIEAWKKGAGAEPFLEYAAGRVLRDFGTIVDTQVTLSAKEGTPDVVACNFPSQIRSIINRRPDIQSGVALIELAALSFDHGRSASPYEDYFADLKQICGEGAIAMEAKTGNASASDQVKKYLSTGFFSGVIELCDTPRLPDGAASGVLQLSESSGGMYFDRNLISKPQPVIERRMEFLRWFECQALGHLLLNLNSIQIVELFEDRVGKSFETETAPYAVTKYF